ncbi:hypothetical protein DERF_008781, partial [Dermatophagoides farinae]
LIYLVNGFKYIKINLQKRKNKRSELNVRKSWLKLQMLTCNHGTGLQNIIPIEFVKYNTIYYFLLYRVYHFYVDNNNNNILPQ